jgi:hypothetical protein
MAIRYTHDFHNVATVKVTAERHIDKEAATGGFHVRDIVLVDEEGNELRIQLYGHKAEHIVFSLED